MQAANYVQKGVCININWMYNSKTLFLIIWGIHNEVMPSWLTLFDMITCQKREKIKGGRLVSLKIIFFWFSFKCWFCQGILIACTLFETVQQILSLLLHSNVEMLSTEWFTFFFFFHWDRLHVRLIVVKIEFPFFDYHLQVTSAYDSPDEYLKVLDAYVDIVLQNQLVSWSRGDHSVCWCCKLCSCLRSLTLFTLIS